MAAQRWVIPDQFNKTGYFEKSNARDAWRKMYSEARLVRRLGWRRPFANMTLIYTGDTTGHKQYYWECWL